jgi:TfoX/Sxy family transcriptional regulator of competence genes
MAEDPWLELVERAEGGPVTRGTMFGSQGLRTGTKYFAIWWHEQLVVKLPADRVHELVASGEGEVFEPMPGRAMNGWILLHGTAERDPVVAEARAHVEAQQK